MSSKAVPGVYRPDISVGSARLAVFTQEMTDAAGRWPSATRPADASDGLMRQFIVGSSTGLACGPGRRALGAPWRQSWSGIARTADDMPRPAPEGCPRCRRTKSVLVRRWSPRFTLLCIRPVLELFALRQGSSSARFAGPGQRARSTRLPTAGNALSHGRAPPPPLPRGLGPRGRGRRRGSRYGLRKTPTYSASLSFEGSA